MCLFYYFYEPASNTYFYFESFLLTFSYLLSVAAGIWPKKNCYGFASEFAFFNMPLFIFLVSTILFFVLKPR